MEVSPANIQAFWISKELIACIISGQTLCWYNLATSQRWPYCAYVKRRSCSGGNESVLWDHCIHSEYSCLKLGYLSWKLVEWLRKPLGMCKVQIKFWYWYFKFSWLHIENDPHSRSPLTSRTLSKLNMFRLKSKEISGWRHFVNGP